MEIHRTSRSSPLHSASVMTTWPGCAGEPVPKKGGCMRGLRVPSQARQRPAKESRRGKGVSPWRSPSDTGSRSAPSRTWHDRPSWSWTARAQFVLTAKALAAAAAQAAFGGIKVRAAESTPVSATLFRPGDRFIGCLAEPTGIGRQATPSATLLCTWSASEPVARESRRASAGRSSRSAGRPSRPGRFAATTRGGRCGSRWTPAPFTLRHRTRDLPEGFN